MTRDEKYQEAERRIEEARRSGATKLKLSGLGLTKLPESIGTLIQLQELDLSSNQLTALPETVKFLTELTILSISLNQFISFPSVITELFNLTELYAIKNKIEQLPNKIGNLKKLTKLCLGGGDISPHNYLGHTLPSMSLIIIDPEQDVQVTLIDDSRNQFGSLLEPIDDNHNQLSSLPDAIANLTNLQELNLHNNKLSSLPNEIANLTNLQSLYLDDNPLNPELAAAYAQGLDAVKAYLRAQSQSQITLNEAKLILIGEGEVGKTSLLGALRGDPWLENRPTTHGVEITIQTLTLTHDSTEITLNGWDFGGQAIYRHTHQLFFTAPALYLAVWNPRRGPEQCRVEEWIKMVKHRAYDETRPDDKPRILVIATHGGPKERLDHIDEDSLREEFGDLIIDFYHVDSKTEYGLDELKQIIAQTAAAIPQVGRTVPASYKQVLDALH